MPEISVIVPVYKVEPYLRRCVDSILNQTFSDFELILVDDGSPDNCPAICDEYAAKDARIKVIHKENGGVSSARNAGLEVAKGKYITFVDSDDYVDKDWFQQLYEKMTSSDYDCVSGDYMVVFDNHENDYRREHYWDRNEIIEGEQSLHSFICDNVLIGTMGWEVWTRLYRASIIKENHLSFCESCENYAEDYGFVLSYSLFCRKVGHVPFAGYFYYQSRPQSMMNNTRNKIKLNSLNEVSKAFGELIMHSQWQGTCIEANIPLYHFLIMETEYIKMYYGFGLFHFRKEMKKIKSIAWYNQQTIALTSFDFTKTDLSSKFVTVKQAVMLSKCSMGNTVVWIGFLIWNLFGKMGRAFLRLLHLSH